MHFLKSHAFLVFFLAVQVAFILWLASGATTYQSCSDQDVNCQAGQVGTTIGLGLMIGLWVAVDLILGITYGIYRLATRGRRNVDGDARSHSAEHRARTAPAQTPSNFQGDVNGPWHITTTEVTYISAQEATNFVAGVQTFNPSEPVAKIQYWYRSDARIPIEVNADAVIDQQGREFDATAGYETTPNNVTTLNPGTSNNSILFLSVPQGDHVKLLRTTGFAENDPTDDLGRVTASLKG
ncbi:hypothetical protein [Actinomadura opuntiae]|uniref:hypothetical protein n=1 Tax=Actinomadura sp. OS1-43 TaxID=604315 RepID=UPI00255B17EE|nr:hypothetical protein [Actinomadura sp. OS1-43]MDL4816186.1 hypothetical protein [Actinomadura sp. OS1-43]